MNNTTIGLDIAKSVFHYAELNRNGRVTVSGMLKRNKVLSYFCRPRFSRSCATPLTAKRSLSLLFRRVSEVSAEAVLRCDLAALPDVTRLGHVAYRNVF